uniref:Uncharacterized protein n=1 Tax=Sipha flava TaxID=143950 RepID=A0A2S2QYT8_9HEMI
MLGAPSVEFSIHFVISIYICFNSFETSSCISLPLPDLQLTMLTTRSLTWLFTYLTTMEYWSTTLISCVISICMVKKLACLIFSDIFYFINLVIPSIITLAVVFNKKLTRLPRPLLLCLSCIFLLLSMQFRTRLFSTGSNFEININISSKFL